MVVFLWMGANYVVGGQRVARFFFFFLYTHVTHVMTMPQHYFSTNYILVQENIIIV